MEHLHPPPTSSNVENADWRFTPHFIQHCKDRNSVRFSDQLMEDAIGWSKSKANQVSNDKCSMHGSGLHRSRLKWWTTSTAGRSPAVVNKQGGGFKHGINTCLRLMHHCHGTDCKRMLDLKSQPGVLLCLIHRTSTLLVLLYLRQNIASAHFHFLEITWRNVLFTGPTIMARDASNHTALGEWVFPVWHAGELAWYAWPCEEKEIGGVQFIAFNHPQDIGDAKEVCNPIMYVAGVHAWEAREFNWWAPLHQKAQFPASSMSAAHRLAINCFQRGRRTSIRQCCKEWRLGHHSKSHTAISHTHIGGVHTIV